MQTAATEPAKLRPGLTALPLDDELVVFSEGDRFLIGLNPSAASVFQELQCGTPVSELPHRLVSTGLAAPGDAKKWVVKALDVLSSHGLLVGRNPPELKADSPPPENRLVAMRVARMPPCRPVEHAIERRYRLLETRALIRFAHPAQARLVDAVLGHLACDENFVPTVVMEIHAYPTPGGQHLRSGIYRDGEPINSVPRLSHLAPVIKSALWQTAVNAHDFKFYIHAGVVGTGETCILLPAAAGSGKSSLTAALTHDGYDYFSDEVALISQKTFQVPPMPLAICTKSTGWNVMLRYYPDLLALPVHRRDDGKRVRYIPPPPGTARQLPASVSHIIFPRYEAGCSTELRPIGRSQALGRLMTECLAARDPLDQAKARELIEWIAKIDCYDLTFSSLDEAVALIKERVPPHKKGQ